MILTKLREAKIKDSDIELIKQLKEKNSKLAELRDESVANIIRIFRAGIYDPKKGQIEFNLNNLLDWFNGYETFGDLVFEYPESLATYTISDFAEHEPKLLDAIKTLLKKQEIINDNDEDLTAKNDSNEVVKRRKLTPLEMCTIVFNYWAEVKDRLADGEDPNEVIGFLPNGDAIYRVAAKDLKDNAKFDQEKFKAGVEQLENIYHGLEESVKVCEKCHHSPCICEAEEVEEPIAEIKAPAEEVPAEEQATAVIEEPHKDVPESLFTDMINTAVQKEWELISQINSLIATFDFDYQGENKEDVINIFNQLVDDTTINIGMLHKAAELVSIKQAELMSAGEQKAEEIISEPTEEITSEVE